MIDDQITVVIPTSPIPSHPSTAIIERVIDSIRFHLPNASVLIMADGVREEVKHRADQYREYIWKLANLCAAKWGRSGVEEFRLPCQQSVMLRECLNDITTPLILFCEHDTFLPTNFNPRDDEGTGITHPEDCKINWQDISNLILSGGANIVRFYLWEKIWYEHQHLMCGNMVQGDSTFIQTTQYSGWPHVASTEFYRKILKEYFRPDEKKMLETVLYGPVANSRWEDFRTTIFYPQPNARRFYHLNGRVDANGIKDPGDW